jgi:peptide deformylase
MILPIRAYGDPVLKKVAKDIEPGHPGLKRTDRRHVRDHVRRQWRGPGCTADRPEHPALHRGRFTHSGADERWPQCPEGRAEDADEEPRLKRVFINPYIVEEDGEEWGFEEGCLSIPNIREEVQRQPKVVLQYQDENFVEHEEEFEGFAARVIQHEHDHLDGVLFIDHLSPLRKRLLNGKLRDIAQGRTDAKYKMRFHPVK